MPKKYSRIKLSYSDLINYMEERKRILADILELKQESIHQAPKGKLRAAIHNRSYQYYLIKDSPDAKPTYIPKKELKLAKALAQRDYDLALSKMLSGELKLLTSYLEYIKKNDPERIYESLCESRKAILDPIFLPDEEFLQKWRSVAWDPMAFDSTENEYISSSGIRVRSKSEVMIADLLEKNGIPYRYEFPVTLKKSGMVRPDFYCLNVRTREEIIWEHFGMMDSISYANKNVSKINDYELSGYVIGKNLIVTFESSQQPLNSNIIKQKIYNHLM